MYTVELGVQEVAMLITFADTVDPRWDGHFADVAVQGVGEGIVDIHFGLFLIQQCTGELIEVGARGFPSIEEQTVQRHNAPTRILGLSAP